MMSDTSQTSDQHIPNTPLKNFNIRCPTRIPHVYIPVKIVMFKSVCSCIVFLKCTVTLSS